MRILELALTPLARARETVEGDRQQEDWTTGNALPRPFAESVQY
jgi:hypothetical protein